MSIDPNLITGRLNVNDYVEARKGDIQKLENLLSNSGVNSKKRAFQSLPRTERRRAASHDPKRVPRRKGLRKRAEFEAIRDNSKKAKEHKRKQPRLPRHVHTDLSQVGSQTQPPKPDTPGLRYGHRQRDKVWLPTHIWHKKRTHMVKMGGIMVPQSASQKQYRRTYRLSSHIDERGAMAWDASYYSTLVVRLQDTDDAPLERIFPKCTLPLYRSGAKFWQGISSAGGPASVYWHQRNSFAAQCNPLLFKELWEALNQVSGLELEDCRYSIGNIDLIGPEKVKIVSEILNPINPSSHFVTTWNDIRQTGIIPSRLVLECIAADPRLTPSKGSNPGKPESSPGGGLYNKSVRQTSLDNQMPQSTIDSMRGESGRSYSKYAISEIPLTIMLLDDDRMRISMPWSWVLPFWLMIFKKRTVLIGGQLELNQLALESDHPCFPYDFPHVSDAAKHLSETTGSLIGPNNRRPSQSKARALNAFFEGLMNKSSELCHVLVDFQNKGIPASGDTIKLLCEQSDSSADSYEGFITTGTFGYSKARGVGIGVCDKKAFSDRHRMSGLVLKSSAQSKLEGVFTLIEDSGKVL